jgi:hypothetical protein
MRETGWPARKRAMAAPDRMDLVPISCGAYPKVLGPWSSRHVLRNWWQRMAWVIKRGFESRKNVFMVVVGDRGEGSGFVLMRRRTSEDAARTGHRIGSWVASWVRVSFFLAFFWSSKVMETRVAVRL